MSVLSAKCVRVSLARGHRTAFGSKLNCAQLKMMFVSRPPPFSPYPDKHDVGASARTDVPI